MHQLTAPPCFFDIDAGTRFRRASLKLVLLLLLAVG
jgi:hypothetical protein